MSVYLILFSALVHGVDLLVLSSAHSFPKTETKKERKSNIRKQLFFFFFGQSKGWWEHPMPTPCGFMRGHPPPMWPPCCVTPSDREDEFLPVHLCPSFSSCLPSLIHVFKYHPSLKHRLFKKKKKKHRLCSISSLTPFLVTPTHFRIFLL